MHYILKLLPIVPVALLATAVIYFVLYKVVGKRRKRPSKLKIFTEFILTGWFIIFMYVTQIMSFGNGMGELYNLKPLHMFYIAFCYGSNNAGMVWQFMLNILMFVPLGFLLPIVFPQKCRKWPKVLLISFCTTLATELLQLISRRGTDIDDISANTIGGLCGFAIFLIVYGIANLIKTRPQGITHFGRKLTIGIGLLCLTATPFVAVFLTDGLSKYGNLYYGHMQPTSV